MTTSEVLYRKWRSRTFAELVGQEHVTTTLLNALALERLAHAYLFTGPRGTGKTSTARLLAKAINCLNNGRGEPCNTCDICVAINDGNALDVVEIDAASNSKVDDVRELIERVDFRPAVARKRVYIIDEVHMLSQAAFNALLKTLEEPPDHVVFILATTEVHKLPATILSRCQRFDFRRVPYDAMIGRLEVIAAAEGLDLEPGVLDLVARSVQGSLRDAENLVDRLVMYYGSAVTLAQARELLGATNEREVENLVAAMLGGDVGVALTTVQRLGDRGIDPRQLTTDVVIYLRDLLRLRTGGVVAGRDAGAVESMRQLVANRAVPELLRMLRILAAIDFRGDGPAGLPLELAVVEAATSPAAAVAGAAAPPAAELRGAAPARPAPVGPRSAQAAPPVGAPASLPPAPPASGAEPSASSPRSPGPDDTVRVHQALLERLRGNNLQAVLRGCRIASIAPDRVEIICSSGFHKGRLDDPGGRQQLLAALSAVLGHPVAVTTYLAGEASVPTARARASVAPGAAGETDDPAADELIELIRRNGGREVELT